LTPHIAGCSKESVRLAAEMVCVDIARWYAGQMPVNCANPQALSREQRR
jgi:D-3-phosphoglycerate dehydrogenase / 2-oxoglutarate reductase